jgi:hypothetical protein
MKTTAISKEFTEACQQVASKLNEDTLKLICQQIEQNYTDDLIEVTKILSTHPTIDKEFISSLDSKEFYDKIDEANMVFLAEIRSRGLKIN